MSENKVSETLLRGSLWVSAGEVVAALFALGVGAVAARTLSPFEFGLMGAVLLVIAVLEAFTQSGFEAALTQKRGEISEYLNVAWSFHVTRGLLLSLLVAASAPFLATFYEEPRLLALTLAVSPSLFLRSLENVGVVHFVRRLEFRTQFAIRLAQSLVSSLIFLAAILSLRSAWAFCVRALAGAVIVVVVSYVAHPHRPKLVWDWPRLNELFRYGRWLTGATLILFVINQGDDIFVSKYSGLLALGLYQMAYTASNLPATHVSHLISRATFPVYASIQGDRELVRRTFSGVLRAVLLVSALVTAGLLTLSDGLVRYIVGERWLPAVPLIHVLTIAGFLRSIAATGGALFQALGRPDLDFKMNLPRFVLTVALIWPLSARFGLVGTCATIVIALLPTLPIWLIGLKGLIGLGFAAISRTALLPAVSGGLLGAALYGARRLCDGGFLAFGGAVLLGLSAWLLVLYGLAKLTPLDFFAEISRVRGLLRRRAAPGT